MSYLPGVPNVDPAPAGHATIQAPAKIGVGKQTGIGKIAGTVGKPGNTQHINNIGQPNHSKGIANITGGDAGLHSLNHYGKRTVGQTGAALVGGSFSPVSEHAGTNVVRGGSGGMGRHVKEGGLAPGKYFKPGDSSNYSQSQSMGWSE